MNLREEGRNSELISRNPLVRGALHIIDTYQSALRGSDPNNPIREPDTSEEVRTILVNQGLIPALKSYLTISGERAADQIDQMRHTAYPKLSQIVSEAAGKLAGHEAEEKVGKIVYQFTDKAEGPIEKFLKPAFAAFGGVEVAATIAGKVEKLEQVNQDMGAADWGRDRTITLPDGSKVTKFRKPYNDETAGGQIVFGRRSETGSQIARGLSAKQVEEYFSGKKKSGE